jgi:hypothetical protein
MPKRVPMTRILFDGKDISGLIHGASLERFPADVETVDLRIEVDKLELDEHGWLTIHLKSPKES